jgi:hypothetical protein
MKKIAVGITICFLSLFIVTTAFASLTQFAGEWENVNPDTRGVTALKITVTGTDVKVHAWGQCHPTDCDWGNMQAYAYGPNVSSNLAATAMAVSVVHKESFAERLMILRSSGTQLQAATYTRFTDRSGRTNYADVEMFKRKVAPCDKQYPHPQIKFDHKDSEGRVYIPVVNWPAYDNEMFRKAPELPPCGLNTNSARTWIDIYNAATNDRIYGFCAFDSKDDMKGIWFKPTTRTGQVYIIINDRACKKTYKSNTIRY